jgi:hypothetical protein
MKRPADYITDDEQIAVVANKTEGGHTAYLTVYSGKSRQNKIFVATNDGLTDQLEDFIQILQQMLTEIKSEGKP